MSARPTKADSSTAPPKSVSSLSEHDRRREKVILVKLHAENNQPQRKCFPPGGGRGGRHNVCGEICRSTPLRSRAARTALGTVAYILATMLPGASFQVVNVFK